MLLRCRTGHRRWLALSALLVQVFALIGAAVISVVTVAAPASATHFRAGQLTWHPTSTPRQVEFHFTQSYRRSYFSPQPSLGSTVSIPTSGSGFVFGDGSVQQTITGVVTSVNTTLDTVIVDSHIPHTYAGTALQFTASYTGCCRLSNPPHRNNPDKNYRMETVVSFAPGVTGNPQSAISPIVDCPKNGLCQFFVPASDPDGATVSWRMATSLEASGVASGAGAFVQPTGTGQSGPARIDLATGLYTWNTPNPGSDDAYYSTQVMVVKKAGSTEVSKTAVDFFIRVTSSATGNKAPVFASPTPADGTVINVAAGQPATFSVQATDQNAGDTVTIGVQNAPAGSLTPNPGNPATASFSHTYTTPGDRILVITAQDQFGLQALQRSVTIRVGDSTPPVVSVPGNATIEATSPLGAAYIFASGALDNVDGALTPTCSPVSGATFALGATTVTCTARDAAGYTGSATFDVTVEDTTGPQISGLGNLASEAEDATGATLSYAPTATDLVDGSRPVTCTPASGSHFPLGTTSVACTSADSRGNSTSASFDVTVSDNTRPTLTTPGDTTEEATGPSGAIVTYPAATATDSVDADPAVSCSPRSGTTFPIAVTPVECSATDDAGNTATGGFRVTVRDTTPPTLTIPGDLTVEATGPEGAVVDYLASATDLVDGTVTPDCSTASGATFGLAETLVTCTAVDAHGNPGEDSFTVTVVDTTRPLVGVPASFSVEATGPDGAVVAYVADAADIVDGPLTPTCSPASGATFGLGDTTVECTATDRAGNTGHATFAVTVRDTTAPVIDPVDPIVVEATGREGADVGFTVAANDAVDGPVPVTCAPESGSTFPIGTTIVNCSAEDRQHNISPRSFPVTVQDTTPPTLVLPPNATVEATGPAGAEASYTVTASDVVDGTLTPACAPSSGSVFPLGTKVVSCTVSDAHGNTSQGTFSVTVVDTTAPVVDVPEDVTVEATGPDGAAATFGSASAVDLVDGPMPATCDADSGATFTIGTTIVACSATDAAGNTGTASFKVNVRDTTAPTVSVPADQVVEATGPTGAVVTYPAATAHDLVDGTRETACVRPPGATFGLGTETVTCTASDTRDNTGTGSFTVTVRDTTPPAVRVGDDVTAEASSAAGATVSYPAPSASDLVDGVVPVTCTHAADALYPIGTTTVTCRATDEHGNTGSATFKIHVVDTTPPAVHAPADIVAEATSPGGASVNFAVTATDLVDGALAPVCSAASGTTFPLGTTTVTCSATDSHDNTGTASFTVTIRDTTPPTISWSGNLGTYTVDQVVSITCLATDAVSGIASATCPTVTRSAASFPLGATTLTASATDRAGNTATSTTTLTVTVTSDSLCSLVQQYSDKAGVANSLCVKVRAAQAAADRGDPAGASSSLVNFRNEAAAQSGKALTSAEAATLDGLARALPATL